MYWNDDYRACSQPREHTPRARVQRAGRLCGTAQRGGRSPLWKASSFSRNFLMEYPDALLSSSYIPTHVPPTPEGFPDLSVPHATIAHVRYLPVRLTPLHDCEWLIRGVYLRVRVDQQIPKEGESGSHEQLFPT